ncbi:hypothetical protein KSS87_015598 [Heliosperma pusillum]|nr:hypothetical protein KSS87_008055 [Heliosperma pusillum]KAH9622669.1 hypothetical protein KSS87_015598 [Heliosperma pusillum]
MWQSMERKACAIRKVNNMFELTEKAKPAVLVSTGKISLGMSHPSGPHDHANDITKLQEHLNTCLK